MISTNSALKKTAKIATKRIQSLSKGKLSEKQEQYQNIIAGLLIERGLDSPFSQDPEDMKEFFEEASRRWKKFQENNE